MKILALLFGFFGLFAIGTVRVLRGKPDPNEVDPDAAASGAAWVGLVGIIIGAIFWFSSPAGHLLLLASPIPYLLGAYSLCTAQKTITAVIAFMVYLTPLTTVFIVLGRSQ